MSNLNYDSLFKEKWRSKLSVNHNVSKDKNGVYSITDENGITSFYDPLKNEFINPEGEKGNLKSLIKYYKLK